jgi:hypothetical protein
MNTNSTQQTDIETSRRWWNKFNTWERDFLIQKHCSPYVAGSIDTMAIVNIWRKETQQTDSDKSKAWWFGDLDPVQRQQHCAKYFPYIRLCENLQPYQIKDIWQKETQSTPTEFEQAISSVLDNGGELKFTHGDWYASEPPHSVQTAEEMQANADLIAAFKDLYNALKEMTLVVNGLILDSKYDDLMEDEKKAIKQAHAALKKANKNYKP